MADSLLTLANRIGVEGFLHCNELQRLVELAAGRDVLEVGSFKGLSAWGMALTARSVHCVDTFRANTAGQVQMAETTTLQDFLRAVARYSNVRWVQASSEEAAAGTPVMISAAPWPDLFGMIFIDAMHTYPEVRADAERWLPRLAPGGIMAFHDYGHWDFPGVQQAVDELFGPPAEGTVEVTLRWIQKP